MNNDTESLNSYFNDNEDRYRKRKILNLPEDAVDRIADMLEAKLGSPDSRPYYCKMARCIPANTLERLAVTANEVGRDPGKLFTYLTKKELQDDYNN